MENLGHSDTSMTSALGGFPVSPGAYAIQEKSCTNTKTFIKKYNPESRLKMQLIVKENKTYFFRRIDSKCAYLQYVNARNLSDGNISLAFGESMKYGNCYFSPKSFISKNGDIRRVKIAAKGKNLSIHWEEAPSLKHCSNQNITWSFKRIKRYKSEPNARLASSKSSAAKILN